MARRASRARVGERRQLVFAVGPPDNQQGGTVRIAVGGQLRGQRAGLARDRLEREAQRRIERCIAESEDGTQPSPQAIVRFALQIREPDADDAAEQPQRHGKRRFACSRHREQPFRRVVDDDRDKQRIGRSRPPGRFGIVGRLESKHLLARAHAGAGQAQVTVTAFDAGEAGLEQKLAGRIAAVHPHVGVIPERERVHRQRKNLTLAL